MLTHIRIIIATEYSSASINIKITAMIKQIAAIASPIRYHALEYASMGNS